MFHELCHVQTIYKGVVTWIETGIVRRLPVSVIFPKVIRGAESTFAKSRACEIEVKSNHGKAE
jgi:hypothetical protein